MAAALLLVLTLDGPGSGSLSVLGDGLIGMWNTLGGVSSALRVPSSCECSTMLISESVSCGSKSLSDSTV